MRELRIDPSKLPTNAPISREQMTELSERLGRLLEDVRGSGSAPFFTSFMRIMRNVASRELDAVVNLVADSGLLVLVPVEQLDELYAESMGLGSDTPKEKLN